MTEITLQEYVQQIEGAIEQGSYTEALAHGKHILQHYPKHLGTYRVLGKAMLEAEQDEYAQDLFRRVLSVDPEDFVARVGLSEVHNRRGELDAAMWHLERAFELAPNNRVIQDELRRLYGRRDGVEPPKVELTQGALARLYAQGDLLSRAVQELRGLLADQPERVDLQVALAEALWRDEQRLQAADVCQQVLEKLPFCLKANLILGEIWASSGREEGQDHLRRAEAVDPENAVAQELLGAVSPLGPQVVRLPRFDYAAPERPPKEKPGWMVEVEEAVAEGPPLTYKEAALVDLTAALEAQIEIPAWLEEISLGEAAPEPVPSEEEPTAELPDWLKEAAEEVPERAEAEAALPEWLAEGEAMPTGDEALAWLEGLAAGREEVPSVEPAAPGEPFGWTAFGEEVALEPIAPSEEVVARAEEVFGWTAFEPEAAPPAEVVPEPEVEPELPPWLERPEMPLPEAVVEPTPPPVVPPVPEPVLAEAAPPEPFDYAQDRPFAAERVYLKEHPKDHDARLALARALWQVGERDDALAAYTRLIRAGALLDTVTEDLEDHVEQQPHDPAVRRTLGDAYMKDGRLQHALEAYRRALASVQTGG